MHTQYQYVQYRNVCLRGDQVSKDKEAWQAVHGGVPKQPLLIHQARSAYIKKSAIRFYGIGIIARQ